MMHAIANQNVKTNVQGFISNPDEWSEEFTEKMAEKDGIKLYDDHWELILYFREYFDQNQTTPTCIKLYES